MLVAAIYLHLKSEDAGVTILGEGGWNPGPLLYTSNNLRGIISPLVRVPGPCGRL